ncbi:hypothetical protein Dxin01_01500 [Deinococcus xinjiangensis]|uniref:PPC domain-containing protein n=1 Tax=Deinococcus xinjiangensis TaxID=457454 RepID=A0ABP9VAL6_9DEIO
MNSFARREGLEAASFTSLGAMSRVTFGFYDFEKGEYEPIKLDEQVEVLSLIGNVSRKDDGSPQVHPHIVVGRRDGAAMGGHLLEGHVKPTLEVTLTEEPANLRRRYNAKMGLPLIDLSEG